jgi:hypothetical protein
VDYLLKPPKLTDLIRAIERALAKRRIELARKRYQKKLERKVRDRTDGAAHALRDIANTYQNTCWRWWRPWTRASTRRPTTRSAWCATPAPSPSA